MLGPSTCGHSDEFTSALPRQTTSLCQDLVVINLPLEADGLGLARPENLFRPGGTHFISHSICSSTLTLYAVQPLQGMDHTYRRIQYTHTHTDTYSTHTQTGTQTCINTYTQVLMNIHIDINTYKHTQTHTDPPIHKHTQTQYHTLTSNVSTLSSVLSLLERAQVKQTISLF